MLNLDLKALLAHRVLLIFLGIALSSWPAFAQKSAAPGVPRNVTINWQKDFKSPDCMGNPPVCKLTLTVVPAMQGGTAASYEWEIWRLGNIELSKTTRGNTWFIGYLEPTDTYTVKVRAVNAAGSSPEFVRTVASPSGCCVK